MDLARHVADGEAAARTIPTGMEESFPCVSAWPFTESASPKRNVKQKQSSWASAWRAASCLRRRPRLQRSRRPTWRRPRRPSMRRPAASAARPSPWPRRRACARESAATCHSARAEASPCLTRARRLPSSVARPPPPQRRAATSCRLLAPRPRSRPLPLRSLGRAFLRRPRCHRPRHGHRRQHHPARHHRVRSRPHQLPHPPRRHLRVASALRAPAARRARKAAVPARAAPAVSMPHLAWWCRRRPRRARPMHARHRQAALRAPPPIARAPAHPLLRTLLVAAARTRHLAVASRTDRRHRAARWRRTRRAVAALAASAAVARLVVPASAARPTFSAVGCTLRTA